MFSRAAGCLRQDVNLLFKSLRFYRPGVGEFGHLPDPPKSSFEPSGSVTTNQAQTIHLINAYRRYGYLKADLDPLGLSKEKNVPELNPEIYGLSPSEELPGKKLTLDDLNEQLANVYCGPIACEFMHLNSWEERQWFSSKFEDVVASELSNEERVKLGKLMLRCENFDHFLALKFPTVKRYGSEGAEAMYGFFSELFDSAPEKGTKQLIIAIAHRGRLNLLAEMMQFPLIQMFRKMKGKSEFPTDVTGCGDVLSHLTSSFEHKGPDGEVHITMLPNPSHLEAVNPVAMGKARGRSRSLKTGDYSDDRTARVGDGVLCVQIHGDGAFTGQGIVMESIALSQAPHFRIGGSVHLITNNQVAFTAEAHIGRSTTHTTDIAKAFECPIIHVNGDNPEEVIKATRLAVAYREKFRKDVFINLVCYRRWGHNELDDPTFTNPQIYKAVHARESVPRMYSDELISQGLITEDEIKRQKEEYTASLMEVFKAVDKSEPKANHLTGLWAGYKQAPSAVEIWDTGVDVDTLRFVGAGSVKTPETFNLHAHLKKSHVEARVNKLAQGEGIDWATAEAMAFGSILVDGHDVRISGQDVGRGTFSHRHAMLVDQETDDSYIPLNNITAKGKLEVANNLLSEEAILGFEFGMSIENPRRLCVWEAQFGDFFNGAQIIIDTFIASAESKWLTQSGLVMLLPHGFDGAGPEHSSCRMERFLQLCDSREDQNPVDGENVNMRIVNPTTSAQYFHLLRRQTEYDLLARLSKPSSKTLLNHICWESRIIPNKAVSAAAASTIAEMAPGTHFKSVITENKNTNNVEKVIFVSGKHWIAVDKARQEKGLTDKVAIVRVEQLCPFPVADLQAALAKYPKAKKLVWSQEEPRNAGAWSFVRPRFENAIGVSLQFAGRPELAWTATAIGEYHQAEGLKVIEDTFRD